MESEIQLENSPYIVLFNCLSEMHELLCSHCGNRLLSSEMLDCKIIIGSEEDGYISHLDCMVKYVSKVSPVSFSNLSPDLSAEPQARHDLFLKMSREPRLPFETSGQDRALQLEIIETRNLFNLNQLLEWNTRNTSSPYDTNDLSYQYDDVA